MFDKDHNGDRCFDDLVPCAFDERRYCPNRSRDSTCSHPPECYDLMKHVVGPSEMRDAKSACDPVQLRWTRNVALALLAWTALIVTGVICTRSWAIEQKLLTNPPSVNATSFCAGVTTLVYLAGCWLIFWGCERLFRHASAVR